MSDTTRAAMLHMRLLRDLLLVAVCLSFAASEDVTPLEVSVEQDGDRNADSITQMMPKVPPRVSRCSWLATHLKMV